jgi:hypothetical protein
MTELNDLRRPTSILGLFVIAGGLIHLALYFTRFSSIPTIGALFVVNAAFSLAIGALLIRRPGWLWVLAALGISAGSLGALVMARVSVLFGYASSTFGPSEVAVVLVEGGAVVLAASLLLRSLRH